MKRAAKKDANHKGIVAALEAIGAVVIDLSQVKNAFDCLVCYKGQSFVFEIKNPARLPKNYDRARLEKELMKGEGGEYKCMLRIQSTGVIYHIVTTINQAIKIIQDGSSNYKD